MRTKTKTLVFAVTAALLSSGAAFAQRTGMDFNAPPVPPVGPTLPGQTCTGSGGTACPSAIFPPAFPSTMTVANCNTVVDVEVGVDISHTWSGDILLSLTSPGGTNVVMIPPPPIFGCPTPDMYTVLDDDALQLVTTFCSAIPPGIQGFLQPANALAAFNGGLGNGTWTLNVDDAYLPFDSGNLNDWSLQLICDTDADLSVTKTGPATVGAGTQMTYSLVGHNDGPAAVTAMVVTDTLPLDVAFVSSTNPGCAGNAANPETVTCALGAVPGPGDVLFDITVDVGAGVLNGTVLTNTAVISSEVNDPVTANDTDTADTLVAAVAPITVTKTGPASVIAGSPPPGTNNMCYNINVANAGPSNVTGLVIDDTFTAWAGVTPPGTLSWTVAVPAAGNINIGPVCFSALSAAPEGTFTNTATVDPTSGNGADLGPPAGHTDSASTTINRVATLTLDKTGPANVTAGSGAGNLSYTVTVVNNGPSDVSGLTVNDVITGPASGGLINVSGTGNQVATVAAGGVWAFNVTGTVVLAAVEGETITNTASVTGSGGGEQINSPSDAVTTVINWPTATFNVTKLYNGGTGASVPVTLVCSDGTGLGFGAPGNGNTDTALVWRRFDHNTGTTCSVVETVPPGYYEAQRTLGCDVAAVADGATYDCTLTNLETVARFHVTKDFSDGSTDDVDVTLSCDTGLPLVQTLTIAGGDPTGVTFVVKDFIDGTMSCAVTEVTNTPGYDLDDTTCDWPLVKSIDGPFGCVVNNTAQDATFTAYKIWNIINEGGDAVDTLVPVTIYCSRDITASNGSISYSQDSATLKLDHGDDLWVTVDTLTGPANCWASESLTASGVEAIDDCGSSSYPFTLTAGSSDSCTFENTVFFEGIPTLSQYGLAILALLTLGLGMVGFRRFV